MRSSATCGAGSWIGKPGFSSVMTAWATVSGIGRPVALRCQRGSVRRLSASPDAIFRPGVIAAVASRFVRDLSALDELVRRAKQMACPRCHRTGMRIGHGRLTGNAERGNAHEIRGRRLLCSARFRRPGCGRTYSVLIATVIAHFTVRTPTVSAFLQAVVGGLSRKAAWQSAGGPPGLSLRSGYQLWHRLRTAQSHIRTALCSLVPPPATTDGRPIAQMLAHLRHALDAAGCVLAAFQLALQRGVLG